MSLFINIPKDLVIQSRDRWNDIKNITKMSQAQFLDAIDLVLNSASFKFDERYYEQIYGSPMGLPLSPILANIIMDDLEIQSIKKLDFRVRSYYRFMDDLPDHSKKQN